MRAMQSIMTPRRRRRAPSLPVTRVLVTLALLGAPALAHAQDGQPTTTAAPVPVAVPVPASPTLARRAPLVPPKPPQARNGFAVDPVTDGAIISLAVGFGVLSQAVLITGEIVPQQPQDASKLLGIDKIALHQHDTTAGPLSTVGLGLALGFAALDPIATAIRQDRRAMLADFTLYAETVSLALAATNLAKLTVRRPRPSAYLRQEQLNEQYGKGNAPSITDTDSGMSFFSGHTALVASVASTATYLAFVRSARGSARPWITMAVGAAMTTFVAIERVRASAHFPTDTIAAAMAGFGIGVLVPHLHRYDDSHARSIWVGAAPQRGGGSIALSGTF